MLYLIDDLEDPFEYTIYSLIPEPDCVDGHFEMHSTGSADVSVFPLLELYARLASIAGEKAIVGVSGGFESLFKLDIDGEELQSPSVLCDKIDVACMVPDTLQKRDFYRESLIDSTHTAIFTEGEKRAEQHARVLLELLREDVDENSAPLLGRHYSNTEILRCAASGVFPPGTWEAYANKTGLDSVKAADRISKYHVRGKNVLTSLIEREEGKGWSVGSGGGSETKRTRKNESDTLKLGLLDGIRTDIN